MTEYAYIEERCHRADLLVEDEIKVGNAVSEGLQAEGYQITWAQTGEEGYRCGTERGQETCNHDFMGDPRKVAIRRVLWLSSGY